MIITIDVKNQETLTMLRSMENLGLIHIRPSAPQNADTALNDSRPNRWLRGFCKGNPEGSVENFLADCRADKERELAMEKRQEEERNRYAPLSP